MQTLREQMGTLAIKENVETVNKLTNVLKMMRERIMDLEFDSESETISNDENVNEAYALLEKIASNQENAADTDKNLHMGRKIEL